MDSMFLPLVPSLPEWRIVKRQVSLAKRPAGKRPKSIVKQTASISADYLNSPDNDLENNPENNLESNPGDNPGNPLGSETDLSSCLDNSVRTHSHDSIENIPKLESRPTNSSGTKVIRKLSKRVVKKTGTALLEVSTWPEPKGKARRSPESNPSNISWNSPETKALRKLPKRVAKKTAEALIEVSTWPWYKDSPATSSSLNMISVPAWYQNMMYDHLSDYFDLSLIE